MLHRTRTYITSCQNLYFFNLLKYSKYHTKEQLISYKKLFTVRLNAPTRVHGEESLELVLT